MAEIIALLLCIAGGWFLEEHTNIPQRFIDYWVMFFGLIFLLLLVYNAPYTEPVIRGRF